MFKTSYNSNSLRPIFKKDDRTKIKNYRPVSHLSISSKIKEQFLLEKLTNNVDTFLQNLLIASPIV